MNNKTLIFDVGGIIIDDSYNAIVRSLNLSTEQAHLLKPILIEHPLFRDVILGKIGQVDFMNYLVAEFPEYTAEIRETFLPENAPRILPILRENLSYILSLKDVHRIYLLSNMSDTTYSYLQKIIECFDGGVFSFQEHLKKPNPEFYKILLNKYNLNPTNCIFFDDKEDNVKAGNAIGIESYLFHSLDDVKRFIER